MSTGFRKVLITSTFIINLNLIKMEEGVKATPFHKVAP